MRACLTFIKATFFSRRQRRTAFLLLRVKNLPFKPPLGVLESADTPGRMLGFYRRRAQLRTCRDWQGSVSSYNLIWSYPQPLWLWVFSVWTSKALQKARSLMPNSACHQLWGKHLLEEGQKVRQGRMNSVLLRCRFRKIAASPLNEDFKLNLLYCCSPLKNTDRRKFDLWWKKDISLFPFLQSHCIFAIQSIIFPCGKARFGYFSYPPAAIYEILILGRDFDLRRPYPRILHPLKAFVKGVRGYFLYYLRRFSLCFCLNNAFQPVLSSQTATMVKKHFDFIICFALLNHKNSIRFVFLRMVILGG